MAPFLLPYRACHREVRRLGRSLQLARLTGLARGGPLSLRRNTQRLEPFAQFPIILDFQRGPRRA